MSVSKYFLILSTGLMIAVSGCTGNRLRQIFAPDREFLSLSELDQYDTQGGKEPELPGPSENSLVSFWKDRTDSSDDTERERVFAITHWLRPKDREILPVDPFLDNYNGNDSGDDRPIVTVGHTDDQPDDWASEFSSETADPEVAGVEHADDTEEAAPKRGLMTFADIMAEFEDEDEDEIDDLDALAEEWLREQTTGSDVGDFDDVLSKSLDESPVTGDTSEDGPVLDFDEPDETLTAEELTQRDSEQDNLNIESLNWELDFHTIDAPYAASQPRGLQNTGIIHGESLLDDSLWQPADSATEWTLTDITNDEQHGEQMSTATTAGVGNRESSSAAGEEVPGMKLSPVSSTFESDGASDAAANHASVSQLTPPTQEIPQAAVEVRIDSRVPPEVRPFLTDFKFQAAEVLPRLPVSTTVPAASTGAGSGRSISPRTWLILLGGVVIAYLLFAPERKNLRHRFRR